MAVLEQCDGPRRVTLGASTLVGRSSRCTVTLTSPDASGRHAAFFFGDQGWVVRDLGSRNGTFVDGVPAAAGDRVPLVAGTEVRFADEVWLLASDTPPVAAAVSDRGRVVAEDGLLALPGPVDPIVTIYTSRVGRWIAEEAGAPRFVSDGDRLSVGGSTWRLELPPTTPGAGTATTPEAGSTPHSVASVRCARFAVSLDEETIELTLVFARDTLTVPQRAHHGLLRVLAQARLDDTGSPAAEQGWLYTEQACAAAGVEPDRLYVDVYRARKQFAALGLADGADIVERRAASRQLRLGVSRVEVVALS